MAARLYRALFLLLLCLSGTYCKKKVPEPPPEEVIEEIDGKKLAELLETEEYLAVFFYTKSCKDCDKILHELERIDDEADQFGVAFVKICERSAAKKLGITTFPQLVYFRNKQPTVYEGDLMNEEQVLEWLTNLEAMELPDKIEEVNAKILQNIIDETDYVAVLFYKQKCKECDLVLHELEEIDDEADQNGIAFVKIIDEALSTEYGLEELPALVYYRKKIPLLYDGDLMNEQDVLSWLNEFKDIGEEGDVIEDVSATRLVALIDESDFLAVLFYDKDEKESDKVLEELENIDDDAERNAIDFVKIDDDRVARNYGIEKLPALVYFEKGVPNFYEGDLTSEEDVLDWLVNQKNTDEIEDVSDEALDILIKKNSHVAVLYYDKNDKKCQKVLEELEDIDDDTDKNGILFVKTDDEEFAKEYDVDQLPQLIFFENQAPTIYKDDLTKEEKVLEWLIAQKSSDEIEDVTPKVLEQMIEENENLAVLFYDNDNIESRKTLAELENIDDDTDKQGIPFVKIDDDKLALSYGVDELPAMVYFEKGIPNFYQGDLKNEDEVLKWLIHQKNSDEIEDVSDKVLEKIIKKTAHVLALFYDREDKESKKVLAELENIDDDTDKLGVQFVKIDDDDMAKEYGIEELPKIIFFEHQVPILYEGDPSNEDALLKWVVEQMESDEIEDVSEKVLEQLIEDSDYLAVLFYDSDNPKSKQIIKELENIDDETDHAGIPFIKIDSDEVAKEFGIDDELPLLVYFENSIPSVYSGDLKNEEDVLGWLLHQKQSDEIEDVTDKMLEMLIEGQEHLVVLFYDKSKASEKVLRELENIDDEADQNGIAFVKTDDVESATKYGIEKFPKLVLFENEIPNLYDGDLLKEEDVLRWLLDQKESDEIEDITENMLKNLVENTHALAVLFYDKDDDKSALVLKELENIDDDTDKRGIPFVKIDDDSIAKDFGLDDELPIIVYFEDQIPSVYEGDLRNEDEVLKWLIHQKEHDTIEEVTDEILENLIKEREYVLVFFAPDSCANCDKILAELEHIDDDTDDHGINFVTTDDMNFAKKKAGVQEFPALVLFRNEEPIPYAGDWSKQELKDWLIPSAFRTSNLFILNREWGGSSYHNHCLDCFQTVLTYRTGDLIDEDAVLKWVTKEETLDDPDEIDEVNSRMLQKMLDTNHFVAVLFYQEKSAECKKVLHELENIDDDAELSNIDFVKVSDPAVAREYDIRTFPSLVFFRHKFPQFYEGDLKDEEEVLAWLNDKKSSGNDVIEHVDKKMLRMLLEEAESVTVFFYDDDCPECDTILAELEHIDDDTDKLGIHFVKTDDIDFAKKLDITEFPSLVYFENEEPSLYFGDLMDEDAILTWLTKQKTEDTIENINRDMLNRMIAEKDYLAVFFYVPGDLECDEINEHLEQIDDDCTDYEVTLVKMSDNLMAKKYGIRNPPGIVFFRHGKHIKYPGDLFDEEEVLEWLTNPENMELSDAIERVNKRMFERILPRYEYIAVLFYGKNCKQCPKVLEELEKIDDEADAAGIHFVKMDDDVMAKKFGCFALPALVFFPKGERDVPIIYAGDLRNGERILGWLLTQKDPSSDHIEDVDGETLRGLIKKSEFLTVYFYDEKKCENCDDESKKDDPDCEECRAVLEELENIDDDTDRHGIQFVKTSDHTVAEVYGVNEFPALLYFERRVPSVYEGDLLAEEEVLQWLIHQRSEDTIETVNRNMLEKLVEDTHYLAVYFYKAHCKACDTSLAELENIDDDLDLYGIQMVKIQDNILAKRYGIKTYPALVYFRNGNPLLYDGDIRNEEMVLEWLIDDDNRELADEIESVNSRMLNKLVEESPFLAVFFYDENSEESLKALKDLENIDDEADVFGIDFVKISDPEAAVRWNVLNLPTLAYFRKQTPVFFDGELSEEEKVLQWLTSQDVFEIKDEIEEVNRKMLDKLLEENEFVAVYFYDSNCPKCDIVLEELEHIDDEADDLDIMFVKIKDVRYSKKYGISQVPALVYFRRKFPSIYRGDLETEEEVLDWLRKNRYRHPELNLFMYILVAISLAFVFYTLFLMFCFNKNKEKTQ